VVELPRETYRFGDAYGWWLVSDISMIARTAYLALRV
jgi:hypothetical protein